MLQRECDLQNERDLEPILENYFKGYKFRCLRAIDSFDMIITTDRNRLAGIAEVKTRKCSYNKMFLSVRKYINLMTRSAILASNGKNIACLYIWNIPSEECFGYANLKEIDVDKQEVKLSGRMDRGYANDMEPMYEIGNIKWVAYRV